MPAPARYFQALLLALAVAAPALGYSGARAYFGDSIKPMAQQPQVHVLRASLTIIERAEYLNFTVSLKMRNFDELEGRLGRGERIGHDVMEAQYLPAASDYAAVRDWLIAQGFTITQEDPSHTNVFARGAVAQIEASLGVTFARVSTADGEFTSAVTSPSLPVEFSGAVLSVSGLQPHQRMHHHQVARADAVNFPSTDQNGVSFIIQYIAPSDLLAAYKNTGNLTGTGQTIAIVMDENVNASDLTLYDSVTGTTHLATNTTVIPVPSNLSPLPAPNGEAAQDVEWAGGMAPNAKVRLYVVASLIGSNRLAAFTQILADANSNHISVVSLSFGSPESVAGSTSSDSQMFAQMAAAGITVCAGSGDGGSNDSVSLTPTGTLGINYDPTAPLQPDYPASDPNVTGVGGTTITFSYPAYTFISETAWDPIPAPPVPLQPGTYFATGGGISTLFARPSWQTDGGSILTNAHRCVPDVAAPDGGILSPQQQSGEFFVILNGKGQGGAGTSLAAPIWAGVVADLNQARASAGLPALGLLGPSIYPLHGTSAFRYISTDQPAQILPPKGSTAPPTYVAGSNGAYTAAGGDPQGYNLCTGLGIPNIAALATALTSIVITAPTITSQPQSTTLTTGSSFTLSVTATSNGTLSYQWFDNGAQIAGATGSSFTKSNAQTSDSGSYTVQVSSAGGMVTSSAATVTVNAPPSPPASSGGGGGGGGGAPSYLFYGALAALVGFRGLRRGTSPSAQRP